MTSQPSIRVLLPAVAAAARLALQYCRRGRRRGGRLKEDRTVVTEADQAIETLLRQAIAAHFPHVNILGEEGGGAFDPTRAYTFAIDPIDGTAVFASGAPSWAICIGVLDRTLRPVAGIVSAPQWGSLFLADFDPHSPAIHNNTPLPPVTTSPVAALDSNTTILIDSKLLRTHYLQGFPGKCRSFGSTALHICLVGQQSGFVLAHSCPVYLWDIAAAHAIAARVGVMVRYLGGQPVDYQALVPDKCTPDHLVAGHPAALRAICPTIVAQVTRPGAP